MNRCRLSFMTILTLAWISFASLSFADDTIEIKELPKAVLTTISKRYPKAELKEARKTLEDKAVIYEVDLTNDKVEIEIAVHEDGRIDWVAVDFPTANLPKPVLMSVRKKYPAATVKHASAVFTIKNGKDHLEHYYVEITTKAGKDRGLDVLPKGEIEEDEEIED